MDPFLGEIRLVPFNFAPKGWAICDGRLLPINQNQALFACIGTYYGGDGRATFALPDLRGRVPLGAGQGAALSDYAIGSTGGDESVKLAVGQLPSHAHPVRANSGASTTKEPANAYPAKGGSYAAAQNAKMNTTMLGKTGSGQPHENRQPYLTLNYIIALQGIFPSQN